MRNYLLLPIVLYCFAVPAVAEPLTLNVTNITRVGTLRIGVYESAEKWEKFEDREEWSVIHKVPKAGPVSVEMELPPGSYVIALYLDLDGDEYLDRNKLGIPSEPFGFSQNPIPLGIPKWKKCVFSVPETKSLLIRLN